MEMAHPFMFMLRIACLEDAPSVLAIYQSGDDFAVSGDRRKDIGLIDVIDWIESSKDERPMLVVSHHEKVIAWCAIEPFYGLPSFDLAAEISIYVLPDWQGKGIGKRFIHYLDQSKEALSFSHLVAFIYARNGSSFQFFQSQGFEQWGLLPNIAQSVGIKEDVYLLGREFR